MEISIDMEKINASIKEAMEKSYIREIEDYYTSYNSPFRKQIQVLLNNQPALHGPISLPNIIGEINKSMAKEVDKIANEAIHGTYINMIKDLFDLYPDEVKFSELLTDILNRSNFFEPYNEKDYNFSHKEHEEYKWLSCILVVDGEEYRFTLHRNDNNETYRVLSMPYHIGAPSKRSTYIKKEKNGNKTVIEIPYTSNILDSPVLMVLAKIALSGSDVIMDIDTLEDLEDLG